MDKSLKPASSAQSIANTVPNTRTTRSPEFKTKVVLEALRENCTLNELAGKYDVSPIQISQRKNEFLNKASVVFTGPKALEKQLESTKNEIDNLHRIIGQKDAEVDFLKKLVRNWGFSRKVREQGKQGFDRDQAVRTARHKQGDRK